MNNKYESPEVVLLNVLKSDIITTSQVENNDCDEPGIELPEVTFPRI